MLGDKIRELRNERGITLKELGGILNVGESTVSMYENNKRTPDYETLKKIADYFSVSVDFLLERTSTKKHYDIETIAAHHDSEEWTEEELAEIERFKEFVRMKRQQRKKNE